MNRLAVIAAGGVLGSLARYGVAVALQGWGETGWPWETLVVNVVGCLVIGVLASSTAVSRGPDWWRPFAITGILGGFTTFSAFALQTGVLIDSGRVALAAAYVLVTMVVGLLAVQLGVVLARRGEST